MPRAYPMPSHKRIVDIFPFHYYTCEEVVDAPGDDADEEDSSDSSDDNDGLGGEPRYKELSYDWKKHDLRLSRMKSKEKDMRDLLRDSRSDGKEKEKEKEKKRKRKENEKEKKKRRK